jgi:ribosomal protein L7/L12
MKMILEITLLEATNIVRDVKGVDEVRIVTDERAGGMNYVEAVMRVTKLEFPGQTTNFNKISAIKRLRELVPSLGLADAKNAVENPDTEIYKYLFRTR